jgi:hypothetical protein
LKIFLTFAGFDNESKSDPNLNCVSRHKGAKLKKISNFLILEGFNNVRYSVPHLKCGSGQKGA